MRFSCCVRMSRILLFSIGTLLLLSIIAVVSAVQPLFFPTAVRGLRAPADPPLPPFRIEWFNQTLDHFNFATEPQTFSQRYIVCDVFWSRKQNAPIIFYSGNEGDIFMFFNNTGFAFTLAQKFGALVIFAEHRYYGQSLPFGADSFTPKNLQYVSVEQALADYAVMLTSIKSTEPLLAKSPVVTLGGSYGGLLSAFFRIKYPHIVVGALAASAPILLFPGLTPNDAVYAHVTKDFTEYVPDHLVSPPSTNESQASLLFCPFSVSPVCSDRIRQGFLQVVQAGNSGQFAQLSEAFRTCQPITDARGVAALIAWLKNAFTYLAMTDYAYPTNFLSPLPAWPVNVACGVVMNFTINSPGKDWLSMMRAAAGVFYNTTGTYKCADLSENSFIPKELATVWTYQTCTEVQLPQGTNGVTDMFPPQPYDLQKIAEVCKATFGVKPRVGWLTTWFGGPNITDSSNIIFSNGKLDPCWAGSVLKDLSPTIVAVNMEQGAHHSDLRTPDPRDPPSVANARVTEINIISRWFAEYYSKLN